MLDDDGECFDRQFAFFTICITNNSAVLRGCLASLCSLLATTNPPCVVVLANSWVADVAHVFFQRNDVVLLQAPRWELLSKSHPYHNIQHKKAYTFAKLEAFRLTQYEKVITFDIDMIFMRNASEISKSPTLALTRLPIAKGKRKFEYVNTGMIVLEPNLEIHSALIKIWRQGLFRTHFSDLEIGEGDVLIELCIEQAMCGTIHEIDACKYNHAVWFPQPAPQACDFRTAVVRHNFLPRREPSLARSLSRSMKRGICRPGSKVRTEQNCWIGSRSEKDCCGTSLQHPWGNAACWVGGPTFEHCCLGKGGTDSILSDVEHSARHEVAEQWFGLSSEPHEATESFYTERCVQRYNVFSMTFAAHSGVVVPRQGSDLSADMLEQAWRCERLSDDTLGLGVYVAFKLHIGQFFARHPDNHLVQMLIRRFVGYDPEVPDVSVFGSAMGACVPTECCYSGGHGDVKVDPTIANAGLLKVLWYWYLWGILGNATLARSIPPLLPGDITAVQAINGRGERWLCRNAI
eukprot:gnl/MRDRNA2_/MRDRNA2_165661_c0_seq1.p1 gnl/MRDRNA2_/MRDRNA2_165661_c0~~gnl/MRDRNA2_/MRDRNA2_165661_c0_seq1.p1  ORF type:complete len:519 (-),score=51.63 gnl/MRDRNA2_/MRDRNA2_165661_c0_seq1:8-1564(-)